MNLEGLEQESYSLYQLDWCMRHGHGLDELMDTLDECLVDLEDPNTQESDEDFEGMRDLFSAFEERGFGGELYTSYDRFVDEEFLDSDYMRELYNVSPNGNELWKAYQQLVGEPEHWMLITVIGRDIRTKQFGNLEDAQEAMHLEMIEFGGFPADVFHRSAAEGETAEDLSRFERSDDASPARSDPEEEERAFTSFGGYATNCDADMDWLIVHVN